MEGFTDWLLDFIAAENSPLGLAIIAASALLEYVVPIFPGDTITLFTSVLIARHGWSFWGVFGSVMLGSLAGSMIAFYVGGWLEARREKKKSRQKDGEERRAALDRLVGQFRRHGAVYLVLNRFLPGLRLLFFVAAGMARMRPGAVLIYSAISAAIWNLGIIALGSLVGANFETLMEWGKQYTMVVWSVLAVLGLVMIARAVRKRTRARRRDEGLREDASGENAPGENAPGENALREESDS